MTACACWLAVLDQPLSKARLVSSNESLGYGVGGLISTMASISTAMFDGSH